MDRENSKKLIGEIEELREKTVIREALSDRLCKAIHELAHREKELDAITQVAKALLGGKSFTKSTRVIFDYCKHLVGATSGYVAMLSDSSQENELLFLDAGGLPCAVDPTLPMPVRGLRAEAYQLKKVVFHNDFMNSQWIEFLPKKHVVLKNVLFAPLILEKHAVGIIGLANKPDGFDDNDTATVARFGELAALALQNSRNLEEKRKAKKQREMIIEDLQSALSDVKKLSGLLPICSYCKKIRDDKGYWEQIEAYLESHSEASFSHSICEQCAEKHFDVDLMEE